MPRDCEASVDVTSISEEDITFRVDIQDCTYSEGSFIYEMIVTLEGSPDQSVEKQGAWGPAPDKKTYEVVEHHTLADGEKISRVSVTTITCNCID